MTSKFKYPVIVFALLLCASAYAQTDYIPLSDLEGTGLTKNTGGIDIATFIPALVKLAIGLAGGLAVIMIIIGGIQYMSTDAWSKKSEGKKTIQNAIVGLLLTIAAYSILYTINPKLVEFTLKIESVATTTSAIKPGDGITDKTAVEVGCKNDCVAIDSTMVPIKPHGYACSNNPCYVNEALLTKLKALDAEMKKDSIVWQVTEAFPPTVIHSDPCHKKDNVETGKCVDAALISPSSQNIVKFMRAIMTKVGPEFVYERCNANKTRNPLLDDPLFSTTGPNNDLRSKLQCYQTTNGQHAHIEI